MYIFYILFLTTNNIIQLVLDEETVIQKSDTQKDKEKKGKEEKHIDKGERHGLSRLILLNLNRAKMSFWFQSFYF